MSSGRRPDSSWWLNSVIADSDLMVVSEVAATLGVHPATVRRAIGKHGLKAPSLVYEKGGYKVYLYTPEDVKELLKHFRELIKKRGPYPTNERQDSAVR